ncbi:MAG: threonine/serine exporter [Clostridiales bacterium]|nr:threonine/serine exporter [Clostridiales bacterium]
MLKNILFSTIAAVSFGIMFNIRGVSLILAALNAGLGFFFYSITTVYGYESHIGMLVASISMSICAEILARKRKTPASVFLVPALIPVVPGGAIFQFALNLLEGNNELAFSYGIKTILEAGALAIGIILVSSLTKVIIRMLNKRKTHVM